MKSNFFSNMNGSGLRIAVVASRFNQDMMDAMLADCLAALKSCNVAEQDVTTLRVPGSFELPVAASTLAARGDLDAIICLGILIKGDTRHDQYIADAVAHGLTRVSLDHALPIAFGVLTTENKEQAEIRALGEQKKGWEAAMSAVEMALAMRGIKA